VGVKNLSPANKASKILLGRFDFYLNPFLYDGYFDEAKSKGGEILTLSLWGKLEVGTKGGLGKFLTKNLNAIVLAGNLTI
jgi:hypothetical protein